VKHIFRLTLIALTLSVGACSTLKGDKIDYKSAGKAPSLEVPPDLTQLSRETRYVVPGAAVTASTFQVGQSTRQGQVTSADAIADVRVQREGNHQWLVVGRSADKLWEPVKDFWLTNGFVLTMDEANLGIMETDWAENRAKIPQDFIRAALGKVLDSLYSTGERDKFRTRLERNAQGGTDIFVSHRGMVEVYNSNDKTSTVWQPREANTELEAEFLRRLMVKLGASEAQAKAAQATGAVVQSARLESINGQSVLQIEDSFERAWRRVGLSLDRTSFTVEDRDRNKGIYFVRYAAPNADKTEPGFFSKLLGKSKTADGVPQQYRVSVLSTGNKSTVSVQNADGSVAKADDAQRILKVLADDLR
jgi:outer membrane protein assembly factor BamC